MSKSFLVLESPRIHRPECQVRIAKLAGRRETGASVCECHLRWCNAPQDSLPENRATTFHTSADIRVNAIKAYRLFSEEGAWQTLMANSSRKYLNLGHLCVNIVKTAWLAFGPCSF